MSAPPRRPLRAAAILGVAAIAVGALGAVALPATADPGTGGTGSTGSITVHKYEQMDQPIGPSDGSELDLSGITVNGLVAGFTACEITGIDLARASDWHRIPNLIARAAANPSIPPEVTEEGTPLALNCGPQRMTPTDRSGAKFANLNADRAYVVYESAPPKNAIQAAAPSIVTVPYPGTTQGNWNYHPHIYPKNTIVGSGSTKTAIGIGAAVGYTITVPVKPLAEGESYWQMEIEDQLSEYLIYTKAPTVRLTNANNSSVTLSADTDYTVSPATNAKKTKIEFALTGTGLEKFSASVGGKLTLGFTTPIADVDGATTANYALIRLNGIASMGAKGAATRSGGQGLGRGAEVVNPEPFFSGQHYQVTDRVTGEPVQGARFNTFVHPTKQATSCPATSAELRLLTPWWDPEPWASLGVDPMILSTVDDTVSDANGFTYISPNRGTVATGAYCGYLEGVPAGYKAPAGPVYFWVAADNTRIIVQLDRVDLTAGDLPGLPVTGTTGNLKAIGAGVTLLAAAGAIAVFRRRTRQQPNRARASH